MANDKMTYQRAQRLKNVGLGKLMVDRIVQGQGVGRSIKSAISDKTTARITRMKAKFDPMNIGRMFGGRLGAYAVGKMTGRREEDLAYFTGARVRASSMENMKVNPLVTKISDGDQTKMKKNDGLADVMARIYNLIKNNSEEQKRQLEIDKNLNIDREKQREKWHSDLIHALTGVRGTPTTATPAKKSGGFFDGLFDNIKTWVEDFFKPFADFIKPLMAIGATALLSSLAPLAPFVLPIIGLVLAKKFLDETEYGKRMAKGEGKVAEKEFREMNVQYGKDALTQDEAKRIMEMPEDRGKEKYKTRTLESFGGLERVKAIAEGKPDPGFAPKVVDMSKAAQDTEKFKQLKSELPKTATPLPNGVTPSTAEGGRGGASFATKDPRLVQMPPAPADTGTRVQSAISQNIDMNLDQGTAKIVTIDNSKTVNASGGASTPAITMDSSVTVRTDDPTLQNILKKITRQV